MSEGAASVTQGFRRKGAEHLVRGTGSYCDDIQLPNASFAVFVRSTAARAVIERVDVSVARGLPGVLAVLSASDIDGKILPAQGRGGPLAKISFAPLTNGTVSYVGEPVAVVVAESRYQAQDAADAVIIDYDVLPAIVDPEAAMQPESPTVFEGLPSNVVQEIHIATDGVDEAFAHADHVIAERLRTQRIAPCPMEPRAVAASYDPANDQYTVWTSTVGVHSIRSRLAEGLKVADSQVRVLSPRVGGSFGGKVSQYPEDVVLAYLAKQLGRPVKWVESRGEHLTNVRQGRDQIHTVEVAVKSDGRVLAVRDRIIADNGASSRHGNSLTASTLYVTGPYDIPCYQVDGFGVVTNKTAHGPVRGIGKADAAYVIERMMDIVADRLGMDPADVRMKNFVPEDAFPYRTATGALLDSGRYATCMRRALDRAGYEDLRKEQVNLREQGVLRGIGLAFVIEPTSAARPAQGGGYGVCRMRMEASGRVTAFPAYNDQGQGHHTTIAHLIGNQLGLTPDQVDIIAGDTTQSPHSASATSSRTSVVMMPAVHVAATLLRKKVLTIAGHMLEIDPDDLQIADGNVSASGAPERVLSLREIARAAYNDIFKLPPGLEPGLEVTGYFNAPNIDWRPDEKGRRNEFAAYPYDATVVVVDVDEKTGGIHIVKYVSVHDCGTPIVPQIVATQHYGSIAQGTGEALFEEVRYDENGLPMSSTFIDYLIPSVNDIPEIETDHMETPTPFTPLGAKGGGETGTLGPPAALGNAIEDALRPLGVKVRERPYTSARIWRLIQEAPIDKENRIGTGC